MPRDESWSNFWTNQWAPEKLKKNLLTFCRGNSGEMSMKKSKRNTEHDLWSNSGKYRRTFARGRASIFKGSQYFFLKNCWKLDKMEFSTEFVQEFRKKSQNLLFNRISGRKPGGILIKMPRDISRKKNRLKFWGILGGTTSEISWRRVRFLKLSLE